MKLKLLVVAVATIATVLAGVTPAGAKPSRGCPPPFAGPLTFAQIIERWPPPPDFPDPEGVLAGYDGNGDRLLCVIELSTQSDGGKPINVIDNIAKT
jgi:hypothetical protein